MIRKLLTGLLLSVLSFFALSQTPVAAQTASNQPSFNFEFLDISNNYAKLSDYPTGKRTEIVVASQNADVRPVLPINLEILINGSSFWTGTIPNNPQTNCRGADGCSVEGPVITNTDQEIEITATAQNNIVLASHSQGAMPEQQVSQSSSNTTTTTGTNTPNNQSAGAPTYPNSSWWHSWWMVGFWVGILWLCPWIFVGCQWARLKFWGFGWPWPMWFWIPLIWFVPWLIIGWVWWLDWWLWWTWIWWLFPWVFWWFWWVVVFKEAIIWHWRRGR